MWLTLMLGVVALAQRTVVSGTVSDAKTGDRLAQVRKKVPSYENRKAEMYGTL